MCDRIHILLTGSTGFIGSAIRDSLNDLGVLPRRLVRAERASGSHGDPLEVRGDLHDAAALDRALDGCDVVIHAASYTGSDEAEQARTNRDGTERLVAAAAKAGVRHIVSLSTAGVYGADFPLGGDGAGVAPVPRSALSASRLAADEAVLAAGGSVVRPNLVYGAGDRWFLGPLLTLMGGLGAWIGTGDARISVIERTQLGDAVARLALAATDPESSSVGGIYHAGVPDAMTPRTLVGSLSDRLGRAAPSAMIDAASALGKLQRFGVTGAQLSTVADDHWFDSSRLWDTIGRRPSSDPLWSEASLDWYRRFGG
ncbi:NAD-dependent epimerase/dehydratase family protein [Plantibacter sp. Mn2098]|uniref:NAD-dependent epimerase/dehydratase family protein n=1 Tax=Plantibacter sp. Mn2098 TaxID=3395266 RepID=UPI003BC8A22A